MRKIYCFDTSLRDGAQTPGVNLTAEDKIKIAKKLENIWLDYIEAGFAASSEADQKAIREIVRNSKKSIIYSLARMVKSDIDIAKDCLKENISKAWIHTFIWTSPLHREKLSKDKKQIILHIEKYMNYIVDLFSQTEHIMFSPEDALRTEEDFLFQVIDVAVKNGAKEINIPDTVWYAQPNEIYNLIAKIKDKYPQIKISIHCHNDLSNAVANSLEALRAWADIIQWTVPPLFGERAGNADLLIALMNIKKRSDYYPFDISNIVFNEFYPTAQFIENISGKRISPHHPVVGRLVHAHSSGIHQDGVNKNKKTYEIISPSEIWMKIEQSFILTNQSGRAGLEQAIKNYFWVSLSKEQLNELFIKFKKLSSKQKFISMDDVRTLLTEIWVKLFKKISILDWEVMFELNENESYAKIVFKDELENEKFIKWVWVWPVDAIFDAFSQYLKIKFPSIKVNLLDFQISALWSTSKAKAQVYIKAEIDGKIYEEYGIDENIIVASIKAYESLINRTN